MHNFKIEDLKKFKNITDKGNEARPQLCYILITYNLIVATDRYKAKKIEHNNFFKLRKGQKKMIRQTDIDLIIKMIKTEIDKKINHIMDNFYIKRSPRFINSYPLDSLLSIFNEKKRKDIIKINLSLLKDLIKSNKEIVRLSVANKTLYIENCIDKDAEEISVLMGFNE